MNNNETIEKLAREQVVEKMLLNITKRATLNDDLKDAAQTIYCVLLTYSPAIVAEAVANNELRFLVARIILNTLSWRGSEFNKLFQKWNERRTALTDALNNIIDE